MSHPSPRMDTVCVSSNLDSQNFLTAPGAACRNDYWFIPNYRMKVYTSPPDKNDTLNYVKVCVCNSPGEQTIQGVSTDSSCADCGGDSFSFFSPTSHPIGGPLSEIICINPAPKKGNEGAFLNTICPKDNASCALNIYSSGAPISCVDTGCGLHGVCDTKSGECVCCGQSGDGDLAGCALSDEKGWSGDTCSLPPAAGTPCPKNKSVIACGNTHFPGQSASDSGLGTCDSGSGLCVCDPSRPSPPGENLRCERVCTSDQQCGGSERGACVAPIGQESSYLSLMSCQSGDGGRDYSCLCKNGWTGPNCLTPPSDWRCTKDVDCSTVSGTGTATGSCDVAKGVCDCNAGYSGRACETQLPLPGKSCLVPGSSESCPLGQLCTQYAPGLNICTASNPGPPPNFIEKMVEGMVGMLTTPSGMEYMLAMALVGKLEHYSVAAVKFLAKELAKKAVSGGVESLLKRAAQAGSETLMEDAAEAIGKTVLSKVLSKMALKQFLELGAKQAVSKVAEEMVNLALGPFGVIGDIQEILGILGMILDTVDFAGMNEETMSDQVLAMGLKIKARANTSPSSIKNGVTFPIPIDLQSTVGFKLLTNTQEMHGEKVRGMKDYLTALSNNSNGLPIIRTFLPPSSGSPAGSGQSQSKLREVWPGILVGILCILALVIGLPVGLAVSKKSHRRSRVQGSGN